MMKLTRKLTREPARNIVVVVALLIAACGKSPPPDKQVETLVPRAASPSAALHAQNVTIVRDDWGIAHVHGKTDADAVFGVIYAQAEDDFNRIETNFLLSQGRLAEAEGEKEIWRDLRMRLFIDPEEMKEKYRASPQWLRELMDAWADALNYYLEKHPNVKPRVLERFEPWMALTFSEGSIGGDIERVSLAELEAFYNDVSSVKQTLARNESALLDPEPTGSNGFAIAPSNSKSKHALLWINPHTSFFFRSESHMTSDEGLNAYGAMTWGQFFVYQGFNEHAGWMHTSSGVDNVDEYLETITRNGDTLTYRFGRDERLVAKRDVVIRYKTSQGMASKQFTVYRTHHGPIVRKVGEQWVSVRLMEDPIHALTQSYLRTKAKSLQEFVKVLDLHTNSSNNTVYADSAGNIAYFHANFIPKRNVKFDWRKPVDGSNPETEWGDAMGVDESPKVLNPKSGWLYNTNNAPWTAAGVTGSPKKEDYAAYVETYPQNPRGIHALAVLGKRKDFTPETLTAAAFDPHLTAMDVLIPMLVDSVASLPGTDARKSKLAEPLALLKSWDHRWSAQSIPTTLAALWADEMWARVSEEAERQGIYGNEYIETRMTNEQRVAAFEATIDRLVRDFGTWKTAWGEVNRFQRVSAEIVHPFDDAQPSIPVPFASARWGSLASFGARAYKGSMKIYGTTGNSFVAVVEFGPKIKARAITAGGQSGDPSSKHFNDQAERYARGDLREVYFYPEQLQGHTERTYRPGE